MKLKFRNCLLAKILFSLSLTCQLGCSPDLFFGNSKDRGVEEMTSYRKLNLACGNMNVSSSTLDVKTFRSILKCFNANQAIEPLDRVFDGMSDEKISPLIQFLNRYFLNNKKRLYEIESTYEALSSAGIIDDAFRQIGSLLKNRLLVSSVMALLREGFFEPVPTSQNQDSVYAYRIDPDFLNLLELIASRLTYKKLIKGLDFGIHLASEKAFLGIQEDWRRSLSGLDPNNITGFERSVSGIVDYLKSEHSFECKGNRYLIREPLIEAIRDGYFFDTIDRLFKINSRPLEAGAQEGLKTQISELNSFLEVTLNRAGGSYSYKNNDLSGIPTQDLQKISILEQLAVGLKELKKTQVTCLKSAQTISNLGMYLMREIAENSSQTTDFILRTEPLNLMALKSFCEYPSSLTKHYSPLTQMAEAGVGPVLGQLVKVLYDARPVQKKGLQLFLGELDRNADQVKEGIDSCVEKKHPLIQWLIEFLADTNLDRSQCQGFYCLTPVLGALTEQEAWKNILLLVTSPNKKDSFLLRDFFQFVVENAPELGPQKSPNDLFLKIISRQGTKNFLDFALSIRSFVMDKDQFQDNFIHHALATLRKSYSINNVHPLLDLAWEAMSDATANGNFFDSIFEISKQPHFLDSIALISKMAEDGRLKQISESLIQIFHKFAEEGKKSVRIVRYKPVSVVSTPLHRIRKSEIYSTRHPVKMNLYCQLLDFNFSFSNIDSPQFFDQVNAFSRCLESNGENQGGAQSLRFLTENESLLRSQIDLLKQFEQGPHQLSKEDFRSLIDSWILSVDNGNFSRFLGALNLAIEGPRARVSKINKTAPNGILKPILLVIDSVFKKTKKSFIAFEHYLAKIIKFDRDPKLMSNLVKDMIELMRRGQTSNFGADLSVSATNRSNPEDQFTHRLNQMEKWVKKGEEDIGLFERIRKWVIAKECATINTQSDLAVNLRVQEILNEPWDNYTNSDLVYNPITKTKEPRKSWSLEDFKLMLDPILHRLSDVHQSDNVKSFLQANLNFLKYFTLPNKGAHYPPEYLLKWLRDRSTDYRLITYYYPGEDTPRVRLVNSLDRFELVMLNVDFKMPLPLNKNMALDFLQETGEAWGDVDRNDWPIEIQNKFSGNSKPQNLAEAVKDILGRVILWENLDYLISIFGFPERPACYRDLPGEARDPRREESGSWIPIGSKEDHRDYRRRLYNLKQVNSVLVENAYRGADGSPAGLEVFRDLFFESFYSNLESVRDPSLKHPFNPPASFINENNLKTTLQFIQMGFLRQIGRMLQRFPEEAFNEEDSTSLEILSDFSKSMIHIANSPGVEESIHSLLNPKGYTYDAEFPLFWNIVKQIFAVIDRSEDSGFERYEEYRTGVQRMRQIAFYFPALLERLDPLENMNQARSKNRTDLTTLLLSVIRLVSEQHGEFLENQEVLLHDLLQSDVLGHVLHLLYTDKNVEMKNHVVDFFGIAEKEGLSPVTPSLVEMVKQIYEDPTIQANWGYFWQNSRELVRSSEFEKLTSDLENLNQGTQAEIDFSRSSVRLRAILGDALEQGTFHPLLETSHQNRNDVYKLLDSLSQSLGSEGQGKLKEFFEMLRRSLSESGD